MPVTFRHTNNQHIGYECVGEGKRKRKVWHLRKLQLETWSLLGYCAVLTG